MGEKRNPEITRRKIFSAAYKEFSLYGFAGARIDRIAETGKVNKRMIYHYYGNKETLFSSVLISAYNKIRKAENNLNLKNLSPKQALEKLVDFTWDYYLKNPEFISLVNSANLHKGRHLLKNSNELIDLHSSHVNIVKNILKRGELSGDFRANINPTQLCISIAALGYYYLTNRFTGRILFNMDFMDKKALKIRREFNKEIIMKMVQA